MSPSVCVLILGKKMSRFREALKEDESGKKNPKMPQKQKKKEAENKDNSVISKDRLPLIGSSRNKSAARPSLSTPQAETRKRGHPPISSVAPDSITPWEGSSHSESSFTSFPPPVSPLPLVHSKPITAPDPPPPPPPPQITNTEPDNSQSSRVKRKPLPPRHPSKPPRLPPLRQVTNLSFSRSFTFSFFELPVHQSARSRAERLRDLTVLLRQFQY
ncbi:pollen-specific leucine-rich repeat extensin-like protein 1 [Sinocyclocheilus rhinocerous]|uniref:pollen-specific leucine-rich repeat extensin-like protein 1 n=1 Tax=Sinocyclocheilus rhinocerous TaxID=307959 RepID=UPI0007B94E11|nr:PREDICTED: pollen-specific leucine-rich repeat extensin-like protein 1 [Sinocyclocheilus rhinocerous]